MHRHRELLAAAEKSTALLQQEIDLLTSAVRELSEAIDQAPRTSAGAIISLTLSGETIKVLRLLETPPLKAETEILGGGIKIIKKGV